MHLKRNLLAMVVGVLAGPVIVPVLVAPAEAQANAGAYLAARQAGYDIDFKAAAENYSRALARDASNARLLEAAAISYLSLGQVETAVPLAQRFAATGGRSQGPQMILVADAVARGDWAAVTERAAGDTGIGPLVDGLVRAWARLGAGDVAAALAGFDALVAQDGLAAFALYHKSLALASVGDFEGAEAALTDERAAPLRMTRRAVLAQVEMLSQLDRGADALALFTELFGDDLDPGLRAMQVALGADEKLPFTHLRNARDGVAEVFFTVGAALNGEAGDDYTLLYARIAEYLRPDHVDTVLLGARLLDDLGLFDLSVETYRKVPAGHPSFHAAELGRAEALRRSGKIEAAIEVLQALTRSHGDLAVVHVTLADVLRQEERFEEAVAAYDRALAFYAVPGADQWFIFYARAISQERQRLWDKAEPDFRMALQLRPDQPQVLNYLGYSLVERQEKLDEALAMIQRAVAAQPDSGYITDSLGWALYRLGRYDEAVGPMERAAELMPVDPVVNDHLGDVLWAVGRRLEAQFQWKRALSFVDLKDASGEADPDRIRRKLDVGLDQVLADEGAPPLKVADDKTAN